MADHLTDTEMHEVYDDHLVDMDCDVAMDDLNAQQDPNN